MATKFMKDQGTISPTFFVGLGGIGSKIVDRIATKAQTLPNWDSQLNALTSFISIDTDKGALNELTHIPPGNRLHIGAFDKAKAIENFRRSNEQSAIQWIDEAYKPRVGTKPGAGQIRLEARLGYYYHSLQFRDRLKQLVQEALRDGITWRQNSPPNYNIYLFSTLAGGTGSGCFLPMAYLLTDIITDVNWQPRIIANLLLSTLVLDKVGNELHTDIHANTYAALKELEHLTKLDYATMKATGHDSEVFNFIRKEDLSANSVVHHGPFFLSFLYDRPTHLHTQNYAEAIADTVYMQVFSPVTVAMASELDNYEKYLEDLTHLPGKYRNVSVGYTKHFGSCGAAAMLVPGTDLLEYCVLRFIAQAIRTQITFGIDKNAGPEDKDRVRALARLATDYSDPKFLRMSESDREKMINASFVSSVHELARQDQKEGVEGGFWQEIVESTDQGKKASVNEQGEEIRTESHIDKIMRSLEETATVAMNKVEIRDRNLRTIHPEAVGQYKELVARLLQDIRKANALIDAELSVIAMAAAEGECVSNLKLNPIHERYLVIRLIELLDSELIPQAENRMKTAQNADISNPAVKEKLERGNLENLLNASQPTGIPPFKKVDENKFNRIRETAQTDFSLVVSAATEYLEAKILLAQLRALGDYLLSRSKQFLRLATKMDELVDQLETEAENCRKGITSKEILPTLRVEVFKTLEEPSQRIWDQVYEKLFIQKGRYLNTFDRQVLSTLISNELKPEVLEDGRTVEKPVSKLLLDIRKALYAHGKDKMEPAIFGGNGHTGINILNGLDLEAKIILGAQKEPGALPASDKEIEAYRTKKIRALAQIAGVLARIDRSESATLADGVVSNNTRLVVTGLEGGQKQLSSNFLDKLQEELSIADIKVERRQWEDPQVVIVHDVTAAVPLYYFRPVIDEIEKAYLKRSTDPTRSYSLHTDKNWEKSLPNLNPRRSEPAVDWSFKLFVRALLCDVLFYNSHTKQWSLQIQKTKTKEIGASLALCLYYLEKIYQQEELRKHLDEEIEKRLSRLSPLELRTRIEESIQKFRTRSIDFQDRELDGNLNSGAERLDGPIWVTLTQAASEMLEQDDMQKEASQGRSQDVYGDFGRR